MAIALEKGLGLSWNLVFQRGKRLPIEDSTLNHSYAHLLWELNQDNSIVPNTSQANKGGSGNFYVGHITSIPYAWGENGAYTQAKYPENTLDTKGPWYVTYCDTDEDPNPGVTGKYAFPGHGKNGNGNTYYADRIVLRQELDYALDSNYVNKYQIGTYYTGVGLWWDSWQKAREYVEKGIEVPDGTYFESHTYGEIFNDYAYNRAEGTYSHAEGYHTYALGDYSHTEGKGTLVKRSYSHAEGIDTIALGYGAHAEGIGCLAYCSDDYEGSKPANGAHAEGIYTTAYGEGTHTEGAYNVAYNEASHAEGYHNITRPFCSHVEGCDNNIINGSFSHVEGCDNINYGINSHVEGSYNVAYGTISHVSGSYNVTYSTASHAEGQYSIAYGNASHAEGQYSVAYGTASHAEGGRTVSYAGASHTEGSNTIAYGFVSHAEGLKNVAYGTASHAEGQYNVAYDNASHAEGVINVAYGNVSHAEGQNNVAYGNVSHAEGQYNVTYGFVSHAEGQYSVAYRTASHAEGIYNVAYGDISHAEGLNNVAYGTASHAEGQNNVAYSTASHAEGISNVAYGNVSHAEGVNNVAYGNLSHAEGQNNVAYRDTSHAEGQYNVAYGFVSHAEGQYNVAYGNLSHAEGIYNVTYEFVSHAEGRYNVAYSTASHAEGQNNVAYGNVSHAEGSNTITYGFASHAEGQYNVAYRTASHAEGINNVAYGDISHAEGINNVTYSTASHTEGRYNVAYGDTSHAEGIYNVAYGTASHAEGQYSVAYGNVSHAEGQYNVAYGFASHAEGQDNVAYGDTSHAEGQDNVAYGDTSHAEGGKTVAYGNVSHAEGQDNVAYGDTSHAEGQYSVAYGNISHAEGQYSVAYGNISHAEGQYSVAYGNISHAEGINNVTYSTASHAEGINNVTYITASHAEGIYNVTYGFASHAEGYKTITYSNYSHAEGGRTITNGQSSHAEGWETYANGESSHAEGWETYANGRSSHAEGWETYANGLYSHAEGVGTVAYHRGEHVQGRFNDYKSYIGLLDYGLFSIGDGYDDGDRHNVMMIVGENARNTSQVLIDARNTVYLNATGYKNSNGKLCAYSDNLYLTSPNATLTFDYANLNFKDMHLHTENVACIKSKESYIKGDTITYVGRDTHGGDTAYTYIVGDKITTYVKTGDNVTVVDNGDNLLSVKKGNMSVDVSKNIIVTPGQYTYNYSQHLTLGGKGQIANGNNSAVFGTLNKATANDTFALGTGLRSYETSKVAVGKWNNAYVDGIFEIGIGTKDDDRKNAMSVMTDGISYFHYQPYTYDSYINSVTYGSWDGNAYTKYSPSDYPDESHLVSDSYFRMSYNALFTTTKTVVDNLGSVDSVQSLDEITRSYTDNVLHYTTGHYDQTQEKYITSKHNIQQESATKELAGLMSGEDKVRSDDLEDRLNAVVKAASLPTFSLNTVTWKVYNNDKSKVLATYNNVTSITAEYGTYVTAENYTIKMNLNGNYDASFLATVTTKGPFGTKVPSFSPIVNGTAVMDGTNSLASTYISPYTGGVTSKNVTTDNQTVRAVTQFGMKYLSTKKLANGHTQVYRINDPDTYSEGNGFNIKVSGAFGIIKWYGTTTVNPATFPASITQQALEAYMTGQNNKSNSNNKNLSGYAAKTDTANKFFFYVYRKALGVLSKAEVPGADATAWFNTKNPKTITVTRTTTGMKEDYYLVYSLNENALNGALLTFS